MCGNMDNKFIEMTNRTFIKYRYINFAIFVLFLQKYILIVKTLADLTLLHELRTLREQHMHSYPVLWCVRVANLISSVLCICSLELNVARVSRFFIHDLSTEGYLIILFNAIFFYQSTNEIAPIQFFSYMYNQY